MDLESANPTLQETNKDSGPADPAPPSLPALPAAQQTPLSVRRLELLLLLGVAIGPPLLNAFFAYFLFGTAPRSPSYISFRLSAAIVQEAGSLALLSYILFRQGRTLRDIGLSFRWLDIPVSVGLFLLSWFASGICYVCINWAYYRATGHYVQRWDNAAAMLGTHVSIIVVVFLVLNAFFEELIVRAYVMSEIIAWKNSLLLAGIFSVGIQSLYHIYQGVPNMLSIAALFSVYAVYYAKSRRILPIILAHLYIDLASAAYLFFFHR